MTSRTQRIPGAIALSERQARAYFDKEVALALNGMTGDKFIRLLNSGSLRRDKNFEVARLATLLPLAGQ